MRTVVKELKTIMNRGQLYKLIEENKELYSIFIQGIIGIIEEYLLAVGDEYNKEEFRRYLTDEKVSDEYLKEITEKFKKKKQRSVKYDIVTVCSEKRIILLLGDKHKIVKNYKKILDQCGNFTERGFDEAYHNTAMTCTAWMIIKFHGDKRINNEMTVKEKIFLIRNNVNFIRELVHDGIRYCQIETVKNIIKEYETKYIKKIDIYKNVIDKELIAQHTVKEIKEITEWIEEYKIIDVKDMKIIKRNMVYDALCYKKYDVVDFLLGDNSVCLDILYCRDDLVLSYCLNNDMKGMGKNIKSKKYSNIIILKNGFPFDDGLLRKKIKYRQDIGWLLNNYKKLNLPIFSKKVKNGKIYKQYEDGTFEKEYEELEYTKKEMDIATSGNYYDDDLIQSLIECGCPMSDKAINKNYGVIVLCKLKIFFRSIFITASN